MPSKNDLFFFPLLLLATFLFFGCAFKEIAPVCLPPPPAWETFLNQKGPQDKISAFAEITIETPATRRRLQAAVIFQGPERLRMEIISPMGTPEVILSAVDGKARIFFPFRHEFYKDIKDLSPLVHLPLEVRDVTPLIVGALPPLRSRDCLVKSKQEGDFMRYEIVSLDGKGKTIVWTKKDEKAIQRIDITGKEGEEIVAVYGERMQMGDLSLPRQVKISSSELSLSFEFSEMERLTGEESPLELALPPGFTSSRAVSPGRCWLDWYWGNP
ncbi:MAG TPA: hypothetical protein PLT64_00590 [Syntrophales bacterium]|mgnify:CR=1 FL=1|nr:hypothetical protein [Syntrophales bacterium]HOL58348.1 hypothetical protein [Syntrophales bacterium]HPO34517.1 hypothetical protein [Syntrophales bacterium]